jgi:uncharacterized DUF497 family protein
VSLQFEWDPEKASKNRRKHGVTFEEAATVFADFLSATIPDPDHSDREDRFIIIGVSKKQRPLIVSFTERGNQIRIISARELTPTERKQYEESV